MKEKSDNGRRKIIIVSLLVFLFIGGGIFMFMSFQGLGDLKGGAKTDFNYGFNIRNVVLPLSQYFGPGEKESDPIEVTKKRLEERGLDTSLLDEPQADISDWMAKSGDAGTAGKASSYSSAPSVRTNIPKMGGGLGGSVGGGSGSSQSTADVSRFGGGADSDNVKISGNSSGGPQPPKGKGTFNTLANARAAMGEGLKSGSAMTARSKWDQGFGEGVTGKKGGDLAYGKSGLVKLDHIKKGDIADLKLLDPGSLKIAEPKAVEVKGDEDGVSKSSSSATFGDKDVLKAAIDALGKGISAGITGAAASGSKSEGADSSLTPPKEISDLATKTKSDGGSYCPGGCSCGAGCTFKDAPPVYAKNSDGSWNVVFSGQQTGADGKTVYYADICTGNPLKPISIGEGSSPANLTYVKAP